MRKRRQVSLFFSISLLFLALILVQSATGLVVTAEGTSRHVAQGGTDSGDCTVPTQPCGTLQYALDAAASGDVIKIAAGTYVDVHSRPAPAEYLGAEDVLQVAYIDKTVTLKGGYLAPGFAEPPDPEVNQTTLDAQGAGRVLFIAGDVAPRIEGLRITGGDATGLGGGVNEQHDAGGGVYILDTEVTLIGNWVYENVAEWFGGGLYLVDSNSYLEGNTISDNVAASVNGGYGGGLALYRSHARLVQNTVTGNDAEYDGGGLYLFDSDAALVGNVVSNNYPHGLCIVNGDEATLVGNTISENNGIGLLLDNSDVVMRSNTVSGNGPGGGIWMWWSRPELDGNRIVGNRTTHFYGGGAGLNLSWYSDALLTNNLIAGNVATYAHMGSAISIADSSPRLLHNTIVSNTGPGGAISVFDYVAHSSPVLTNTILVSHTVGISVSAGNTATLEATFWGDGDWTNDVDWYGEGVINTGDINIWGDPSFTCTGSGCPAPYHLDPSSDALNEGVATRIRTDIDSELRPYQAPDLGADEYWPPGALRFIYLPLVLRNAP